MSFKFTRIWFCIVIAVCIAMLIFPPWVAIQHLPEGTSEVFQGYFLIFDTPERYQLVLLGSGLPYILSLDIYRLVLQLIAWLLLSLLFTTRKVK
ncbi:hypothetical protein ACVWV0_004624 [Ewingella americana]